MNHEKKIVTEENHKSPQGKKIHECPKKIITIDTISIVNIKIDVELKLGLCKNYYLSLMKHFPSFNLVDIIFTRIKHYKSCTFKVQYSTSLRNKSKIDFHSKKLAIKKNCNKFFMFCFEILGYRYIFGCLIGQTFILMHNGIQKPRCYLKWDHIDIPLIMHAQNRSHQIT